MGIQWPIEESTITATLQSLGNGNFFAWPTVVISVSGLRNIFKRRNSMLTSKPKFSVDEKMYSLKFLRPLENSDSDKEVERSSSLSESETKFPLL